MALSPIILKEIFPVRVESRLLLVSIIFFAYHGSSVKFRLDVGYSVQALHVQRIDERTGGILISMICSPYPLSRRHSASVVSNCLRHRLSASVTASFLHCSLKLAFITNPIYDAPCPSLVLYFRYSRSCRSQCPREIRQTLPGRSSRRR